MSVKVTYIISNIDKAIAFEWIAERIDPKKISLSFILLNKEKSYLYNFLQEKNIEVHHVNFNGKKDLFSAVISCYSILRKIKPDIVHCHLFEASLAGLTAARLAGIKKRIYTRHHSTLHHEYFPGAVKWDKYNNRMASDVIAISDTVKQVLLKERADINKIKVIYHGFDLERFYAHDQKKTDLILQKYNASNKHPVIGVISRLINWKGVQYTVPAFKKLLERYPDALLLLFNAKGTYEPEIDELLRELPESSYKKIYFEPDITSLYHIFDVFVHVPVNKEVEAFGQTYVECLAAGVPLVATLSGIGNEILKNEVNSLIVPHKDSGAIYQAILRISSNDDLRQKIKRNALASVKNKFSIEKMIEALEQLYLQ